MTYTWAYDFTTEQVDLFAQEFGIIIEFNENFIEV